MQLKSKFQPGEHEGRETTGRRYEASYHHQRSSGAALVEGSWREEQREENGVTRVGGLLASAHRHILFDLACAVFHEAGMDLRFFLRSSAKSWPGSLGTIQARSERSLRDGAELRPQKLLSCQPDDQSHPSSRREKATNSKASKQRAAIWTYMDK